MPIASPETYAEMLDKAKEGRFAYPAINVTSSQTLNAALRGFAEAEQRRHRPGLDRRRRVPVRRDASRTWCSGAQALAEYAHHVAKNYPVNIALHTDHCPKDKLDAYIRPLIAISQERVAEGGPRPAVPVAHVGRARPPSSRRTSRSPTSSCAECAKAKIIIEIEIGVVGGEEDGVSNEINEKLYTTPKDMLRVAEVLGTGEKGRYLLAAVFGNVHGVYKPGSVKLRPVDPQGGPGRRRREGRQGAPVRPGLPRRLRLRRSTRSARRSTTAS